MDSAWSTKPYASWRRDPREATQGELQGELQGKLQGACVLIELSKVAPHST